MNKDILGKVVAVEKEIQQSLESEREHAAQRIDELKTAADNELATLKKELEATLTVSIDESLSAVQKKARTIIDEAEAMSRKLEQLKDEQLNKIAIDHITEILPGE